ncbi:MAG: hypothetical protein WCJ40_11485 [Planctomycetota bacterium]|nr:hypothetical protein [Planctomycetota bacterium]
MKLTKDLTSPWWMYAKAVGFMIIGLSASGLLILEMPRWDVAIYLAISIWAFARAYYFAFYVVEHYIDPDFQFAGLMDFLRYVWSRQKKK